MLKHVRRFIDLAKKGRLFHINWVVKSVVFPRDVGKKRLVFVYSPCNDTSVNINELYIRNTLLNPNHMTKMKKFS